MAPPNPYKKQRPSLLQMMAPPNPYKKQRPASYHVPPTPASKASFLLANNDHDNDDAIITDSNDETIVSNGMDSSDGAGGDRNADLFSFHCFQVFATGFCCSHCGIPIGLGVDALHRHIKKSHPDLLPLIDNVTALHKEMIAARERLFKSPPPKCTSTLSSMPETRLKCLLCSRSYMEAHNFYRHIRRSNGRCDGSFPTRTAYIKTECGQFVEATQFSGFQSDAAAESEISAAVGHLGHTAPRGASLPPPVSQAFEFNATESVLKKYIRKDEEVGPYTSLFYPLVKAARGSFDILICSMVDSWKIPPSEHEHSLRNLLQASEQWMYGSARRLVEMVPANYRAALQVFGGQDIGEVSQNYLYTFRHKESLLLVELKHLLSFLWRHPSRLMEGCKSMRDGDPLLVPAVLLTALMQRMLGFNQHPVAVDYCLSRCFRKNSQKVQMISCGDVASVVASVLSILRAGVCSYMVLSCMPDHHAIPFVQSVRSSRVVNVISPMIRRLRELQRRKPKRRKLTVSPQGDIAVDGFEFPREKWSKAVPTLVAVCRSLLDSLFDGDDWSLFLDTSMPIQVSQSEDGGKFNFLIPLAGRIVTSSQLVLKHSVDEELAVDRLCSHVEIGFHGFGGGSTRYEELRKLTRAHGLWHRGTLYYSAESIKKYSFRSRSLTAIEHKLPAIMARIYLLFGVAMSHHMVDDCLIPERAKRTHTMTDAIAEMFNFAVRPSATQARQLWASV